MSKYSSDSDSYTEKRTTKKSYSRRSRERSYSSDSSSSKSKKRKDKKYKRDRSRSRGSDKYSRTRVDRSSSYQKSYSSSKYSPDRSRKRSNSRDHYKSKYKRSKSRERSSTSRRSRSNSRTYRKSSRKDKSPSTSSNSSASDKQDKIKENPVEKSTKTDIIKTKLKKLTVLKNEEEKINSNIIDEINDDSFAPKPFVSSKQQNKKVTDNIVIDLKSQTIKVPDVEITEPDSIFHPNLFINEEARMEKWVKELYIYRQKAYNGELNNI